LNQTNIIVNNATKRTLSLSGLANGVYDWNVSCTDAAGNTGMSEERVFYISAGTPSEFNISPNKNSYSIGETGYLIINAKPGSNLTLFVDAPLRDSFFKYFNGVTYPLVELLNFTNNAGTYNIDGIFNNAGQLYIVKTSFDVTNTFYVEIEANDTTGIPGTTFNFEANATGGIGGVTYEWDFDDGNTTNGTEVAHSFADIGEYSVEVTATDSRGNTIKDTVMINIYRKHSVDITVRELQTQNVMAGVAVEVDDERKLTDDSGNVHFEVYEGKRRIYIAHSGYEWVKQVRNITENLTLTIELNNTAITNYTPPAQRTAEENATQEAENQASADAERLLTIVSSAIENLNTGDESTKAVLDALSVDEKLQQARKTLRQVIRDLGNTELSGNLTKEEKTARVKNITTDLDRLKTLVTSVTVDDTTEYVDYPKSSDISMLSAEYLRYKNANYTKGQKEDYIEANTLMQDQITIETRIALVRMELLSGDETEAAVVINRITKQPADVKDTVLVEYVPKEVAESASEIKKITEFSVVKSDPILEFDPTLTSYAYYVAKKLQIEDLKKTKHVLLRKPASSKAVSAVTGFSIISLLKPKDPKLAAQILVIAILLIAYIIYHFDVIDRIRDWRAKKPLYNKDMSYRPQSTAESISDKVMSFVRREEDLLSKELTHIRALMAAAHSHAENMKHEHAAEGYKQVMNAYRELSHDAKGAVHDETKHLFNKVLLSKIEHLISEAQSHLSSRQHAKARSRYSEIQKLYAQLEKQHRASVSERCMKLHEKLFEQALA
ncbi:PKD domain-containing protein, partial [Candidatus Woesearchaeota archaeon]|nr:PKD domain-containing protein [Candidatus Woesearchaeota archaeon]